MAAPASPCTGVCRVGFNGVCKGCGRRLEEIAEWPTASDARKREIRAAARERRTRTQRKDS